MRVNPDDYQSPLLEPAIECLEKAARNGLTHKGWYEHDSNLDPLREHPRFQELAEKLC